MEQKGKAVNGKQQVLEMLLAADPAFRESLLLRLARQDPKLAGELRQRLAQILTPAPNRNTTRGYHR
jgi:hypothetical protein